MNVTLKLPDKLCREARHRAVDESKSLSAWIADLIASTLRKSSSPSVTLLHDLGDESLADADLMLPDRHQQPQRQVEFP